MKALFLALALLFANGNGCDEAPPKPTVYYCQGYVRNYWADTQHCRWELVIEGEDGRIWTVHSESCQYPPVWVGLHGQFAYVSDPAQKFSYTNFTVLRRLQ